MTGIGPSSIGYQNEFPQDRSKAIFQVPPKESTKASSPSPQGSTPSPPPTRPMGHHFVAVSYSIGSAACHVCLKSLENRPALRCEICLVDVHDSHSCRDQIADCTKFKAVLNKVGWRHESIPVPSSWNRIEALVRKILPHRMRRLDRGRPYRANPFG